jgi:two-component SAPR family response regulator
LGGVHVIYRGQEIGWASKKAAEFFFYLLERPNGVTTWEAAEALWRDKDESRAASVFHTTLHRLRKTLGEDVVYTKNRRYYLKNDLAVAFDVAEYQNLVRETEQAPSEVLFARAIELYGGAYMSGCDSGWCEDKREMLHATHLSLLLDAARFAESQNDLRRAAWYAHLATQHEPMQTKPGQVWHSTTKPLVTSNVLNAPVPDSMLGKSSENAPQHSNMHHILATLRDVVHPPTLLWQKTG